MPKLPSSSPKPRPPAARQEALQRRSRTEPIGSLLPDVGGMAFRRFGFAQGALIRQWSQIVGPVYAPWCIPQSIRFPRGSKGDGTLIICVEGPFCTQLQHVAPQIIERVNRVFGHEAVTKIRLVQGEVPRAADRSQMPLPARQPTQGNVSTVADPRLRTALEALAGELDAGDAWTGGTVPKVR